MLSTGYKSEGVSLMTERNSCPVSWLTLHVPPLERDSPGLPVLLRAHLMADKPLRCGEWAPAAGLATGSCDPAHQCLQGTSPESGRHDHPWDCAGPMPSTPELGGYGGAQAPTP